MPGGYHQALLVLQVYNIYRPQATVQDAERSWRFDHLPPASKVNRARFWDGDGLGEVKSLGFYHGSGILHEYLNKNIYIYTYINM